MRIAPRPGRFDAPQVHSRGHRLSLTLVVALAACGDVVPIPDGTPISCANGVCPRQLHCNSHTLRCQAGTDEDAPNLEGTVTVEFIGPPMLVGPGAPLGVVKAIALAPQGNVTLAFLTTEPATVDVTGDGLFCSLRRTTTRSTDFEAVCKLDIGFGVGTEGNIAINAKLADAVGNTQVVTLATIAFDAVLPAAPALVTLERTPWGDDARAVVHITSAEADSRFMVFSGPLQLTTADPSTDITLGTTAVDMSTLEVVAFDTAANPSPRTRVTHDTWHATLRGRVAGQSSSNPHQLALLSKLGPPELELGSEVSDPLKVDGGLASEGGASWRARSTAFDVGVHTSTWDWRRQRAVILTGDRDGWDGGVFEWSPESSFVPVSTQDPERDGDPQPRLRPALAWDPSTQRVVLVGGGVHPAGTPISFVRELQEVWEWSGISWRSRPMLNLPPPGVVAVTQGPPTNRLLLIGDGGTTWQLVGNDIVTLGNGAKLGPVAGAAYEATTGDTYLLEASGALSKLNPKDEWMAAGMAAKTQRIAEDPRTGRVLIISVDGGAQVLGAPGRGFPLAPDEQLLGDPAHTQLIRFSTAQSVAMLADGGERTLSRSRHQPGPTETRLDYTVAHGLVLAGTDAGVSRLDAAGWSSVAAGPPYDLVRPHVIDWQLDDGGFATLITENVPSKIYEVPLASPVTSLTGTFGTPPDRLLQLGKKLVTFRCGAATFSAALDETNWGLLGGPGTCALANGRAGASPWVSSTSALGWSLGEPSYPVRQYDAPTTFVSVVGSSHAPGLGFVLGALDGDILYADSTFHLFAYEPLPGSSAAGRVRPIAITDPESDGRPMYAAVSDLAYEPLTRKATYRAEADVLWQLDLADLHGAAVATFDTSPALPVGFPAVSVIARPERLEVELDADAADVFLWDRGDWRPLTGPVTDSATLARVLSRERVFIGVRARGTTLRVRDVRLVISSFRK